MTALSLVLASAVVGGGACLQGAVGFGLALVSAPMLVLIDPRLVPGPLAVSTLVLNVLMIRREGSADTDRRIVAAIVGLIPGVALAAVTLAALPQRQLSIAVGLLVLGAVGLAASGLDFSPSRPNLLGAGALAGFMGTIAGVSGPPLALVYQRATGPILRGTLPRFFLAAGAIQVVALIPAGRLRGDDWWAALALVPGIVVGFAASRPLTGHVDRRTARPLVLGLAAAAAIVVLARELL